MGEDAEPSQEELVYQWRLDALMHGGYSEAEAQLIALSDADLHQALQLLARGCERETAVKILL